jgi:hypothetical protein
MTKKMAHYQRMRKRSKHALDIVCYEAYKLWRKMLDEPRGVTKAVPPLREVAKEWDKDREGHGRAALRKLNDRVLIHEFIGAIADNVDAENGERSK